ncbi:MAG: hypothetical protein D6815_03795, partial [Candidatus Dadabacteria bacterium]
PTGPKHNATSTNGNGRQRRPEPNPLGGNFILMPSLLEYLSPDLTLPEQYFYRQRNDDGMGAEKALMYAVLKDGIRCFYKHVGATRRKYRKMSAEAEEWILEDCWDYPFSFRIICDTLGIDADSLRKRLMDWKEAELERRRITGDTKSIQVGRSPFPTMISESDLRAEDESEQGEDFAEQPSTAWDYSGEIGDSAYATAADPDDLAAVAGVEMLSLDDPSFGELEEVA